MSQEDLNDLASTLGQLQPTSCVDRDRLLFDAGRASAPPGWKWPLAAGASSLLTLSLGLVLLVRPVPPPIVRIVEVPVPGPVVPPASQPSPEPTEVFPAPVLSAWSELPYHRMQEQLARWGLDAVPPPAHSEPPRQPESVDALLKSFEVESSLPK